MVTAIEPMMPERIALSHAFGGLAVALVGVSEWVRHGGALGMLGIGYDEVTNAKP